MKHRIVVLGAGYAAALSPEARRHLRQAFGRPAGGETPSTGLKYQGDHVSLGRRDAIFQERRRRPAAAAGAPDRIGASAAA
ncbi:hypothetical protein AVW11_14295 [Streptomyces amritsarensis]|uniref:Uncharacterized protein n=1 Tax=Streptomyces amritsarensis TaxID=681158 RepID=A0ABX3G596_9ACTN|nr:hypothetical protein [Streptomyces amritsarensis]OLZ67040.1 hypothetical protein AVW11_14295 [Streptomyces amritsarensis]